MEGVLDEFQFHQPLVACTLIGLVTGHLQEGILLGGSLQMMALGWANAVSYTHLDVYKRQDVECRGDDFLDRLVGHIGVRADIHQQPHDEGVEPVSYTHLYISHALYMAPFLGTVLSRY